MKLIGDHYLAIVNALLLVCFPVFLCVINLHHSQKNTFLNLKKYFFGCGVNLRHCQKNKIFTHVCQMPPRKSSSEPPSTSEEAAFVSFLMHHSKKNGKDFNLEFVQEFHKLTFNSIGSNQMHFDLHHLSKWVDMTPGNILHNILRNKKLGYAENVDFTIEEKWSRDMNNLRYKPIKMTHHTFVSVLLMMHNEAGQLARKYYIWLEEALQLYLKGELTKRTGRILELETHLKAKNAYKQMQEKESVVYVFPATENAKDAFRIGQSTDFVRRMRTHNSPRASPIMPVYTLKTLLPICVEGVTKYALKPLQYEKGREVYIVSLRVLKSILHSAASICESVQLESARLNLGKRPLATSALSSISTIPIQDGGTIDEIRRVLRHIHRKNQDQDQLWFIFYTD